MAAPSSNLFFGGLPADFNNDKVKEVFGAYGVIVSSKFIAGAGKHSAIVQYKTVDEAAWIVENLNGNIPEAMDTPVTVKFASDGAGGGAAAGKGAGAGAWGKAPAGGMGGGAMGGGWGGGKDPWGAKGGGKDAFGGGKDGKNPCGIKMLVNGLMQAGALPGGKWSNDQNALFISGLPDDTTDADLYAIFSPFGAIPCRGAKVMCTPDGACKGFGFVNYVEPSSCEKATQTLNGTGMPNGKTLSVRAADGGKGGGKGKDGEGKAKKCKWCEQGECWDHGQVAKPGKGGK